MLVPVAAVTGVMSSEVLESVLDQLLEVAFVVALMRYRAVGRLSLLQPSSPQPQVFATPALPHQADIQHQTHCRSPSVVSLVLDGER